MAAEAADFDTVAAPAEMVSSRGGQRPRDLIARGSSSYIIPWVVDHARTLGMKINDPGRRVCTAGSRC